MSERLYDRIGVGYAEHRRPDARIAAAILAALGPAETILNVGAGAGSYEPSGRRVAAVEPSAEMVRQRPEGSAPVVRTAAEHLPFRSRAFDAALAILTIHHWPDQQRGLRELRRVARERVVILTWDPGHPGFWLVQEYFPEILDIDQRIFPPMARIQETLGPLEVRPLPVPADCSDGFLGAYWRRPETYLDEAARGAISAFPRLPEVEPGLDRLRADLRTGAWERAHGHLRALRELDVGYRLLIARG